MALPYQDPDRPASDRARDLLSRMTLEEKTAQMHALWLILSEDGEHRPDACRPQRPGHGVDELVDGHRVGRSPRAGR